MASFAETMLAQQAEIGELRRQFAKELQEAVASGVQPGAEVYDNAAYNRSKRAINAVYARWYGRYRGDTSALWYVAIVNQAKTAREAAIAEQATPERISAMDAVLA